MATRPKSSGERNQAKASCPPKAAALLHTENRIVQKAPEKACSRIGRPGGKKKGPGPNARILGKKKTGKEKAPPKRPGFCGIQKRKFPKTPRKGPPQPRAGGGGRCPPGAADA